MESKEKGFLEMMEGMVGYGNSYEENKEWEVKEWQVWGGSKDRKRRQRKELETK